MIRFPLMRFDPGSGIIIEGKGKAVMGEVRDAERLILILAQPSRWRDGVQAALEALPRTAVLATGDPSAPSRLDVVDPTAVVLEARPYGHETRDVLRWLKAAYRETKCLVLVSQAEEGRVAKEAGADDVLPRRASSEQLRRAIELLLSSAVQCGRARDTVALSALVGRARR